MPINRFYLTWLDKIKQLWPQERVTTQRNMAWLLAGLWSSHSVRLSRIASQIPSQALLLSMARRLSRFLANADVRVRAWYAPIARELLRRVPADQPIRLIVDSTKVGAGHQWLLVSLAYHHRALPLCWSWVPWPRGHCSGYRHLAVLSAVRQLLPAKADVWLVGDSEFGSIEVLRQADQWGWKYALRQKGSHLVRANDQDAWHRFDSWVQRPGERVWRSHQQLTASHAYQTNLLADWQVGQKDPCLLATNLPDAVTTQRAYRRRMWIDESFGDMKDNGFDLEKSHLCHFAKLSRLTLAVCLLYVSTVTLGVQAIKNGQRHFVDRRDRRDLSVFRIGLYMLERLLVHDQPWAVKLGPYF
jgi:hypothetical protein